MTRLDELLDLIHPIIIRYYNEDTHYPPVAINTNYIKDDVMLSANALILNRNVASLRTVHQRLEEKNVL